MLSHLSLLLSRPASFKQYLSRTNANKHLRIHHHLRVLVSRGLYKAFTLLYFLLYVSIVAFSTQPRCILLCVASMPLSDYMRVARLVWIVIIVAFSTQPHCILLYVASTPLSDCTRVARLVCIVIIVAFSTQPRCILYCKQPARHCLTARR